MYFDIGPKERIKDFFNYREEYRKVRTALRRGERIIAIIGVRRVGKTSLMNVLFNDLDGINVWVDGRIINDAKDLIAVLEQGIEQNGGIFGSIKSLGISISGMGITTGLSIEPKTKAVIRKCGKIHLFIDEAQYANCMEIAKALSYLYDRFPNVQIIISGSEIRLIDEVLGITNSSHPLYGRRVEIIELKRLDKEKSLEFLRLGFKQVSKRVPSSELEEVVERLDGLIGWLTLYGYERAIANSEHPLEKVEYIAMGIVEAELKRLLGNKRNKALYISILRYANNRKWKELLSVVRDEIGKVNNASFSRALKELVRYSFIEKINDRYVVADPIIRTTVLKRF